MKIGWNGQRETHQPDKGKSRQKRGGQPPDSSHQKSLRRKFSLADFGCDDRSNQIPGNDKKDVNANVAAGKTQARVIQDYKDDREGAKAIYIASIFQRYSGR